MTYCVTGKGPCSCQPQEGVFCHYDKNIHPSHQIIFEQSKEIDAQAALIEQQAKRIAELEADAMRYRFLRDNKHLDKWWSVAGPSDRCENIDADIDEAMKGQ